MRKRQNISIKESPNSTKLSHVFNSNRINFQSCIVFRFCRKSDCATPRAAAGAAAPSAAHAVSRADEDPSPTKPREKSKRSRKAVEWIVVLTIYKSLEFLKHAVECLNANGARKHQTVLFNFTTARDERQSSSSKAEKENSFRFNSTKTAYASANCERDYH